MLMVGTWRKWVIASITWLGFGVERRGGGGPCHYLGLGGRDVDPPTELS